MVRGYWDALIGNSAAGSPFPIDLPDEFGDQARTRTQGYHPSEDMVRRAVTAAAAEYLQAG